jgi:hypothetical protein
MLSSCGIGMSVGANNGREVSGSRTPARFKGAKTVISSLGSVIGASPVTTLPVACTGKKIPVKFSLRLRNYTFSS